MTESAETPMVYRMAEAMYERFQDCVSHSFSNGGRRPWTPQPFNEADAQVRDFYIASARAGIEMMREPTEAMLEASCDAHREQWAGVRKVGYRPGPGDVAKPCWVAMIDAALSNSNPTQKGE